jgi:hypothetical protein
MPVPDTTELRAELLGRLQPVVRVDRRGMAEFVGTSMLLRVNERTFLASATHVLRTRKGTQVHVLGDQRNVHLRQAAMVAGAYAHSAAKGTDQVDVSFLEISARQVEQLGTTASVQMNQVDVDESGSSPGRYLAIGYPASRTTVRYSEGELKVSPFAIHTGRVSGQICTEVGVSPHSHLVLRYDRSNVAGPDELRRQGPLPFGMSGGGVWRIANVDPNPPGLADAKLVAIMTAYRPGDRLIMCTRIALLLEGIRLRHPELSAEIPKTAVIRLNARRG